MTPRIALLANPSAAVGRSLKCLDAVRAQLELRGAGYTLFTPAGPEAAVRDARAAAERGETVVGVGGDGTVGLLAGALRGSDVPLAVVPAGRGNDFARVMGIPTDPRAAADVALDGEERRVDVGDVDGRAFVCIASLGFDSDANRIANQAKLVRGNLVYLYAALRAMAAWKHANFRVVLDGEPTAFRGWCVAVANSKAYGGGMFIAPHAELDDGKLDVMLVEASSKMTFLRDLPKVFKGTHVDNPRLRFLKGEVVEVSADRPFTIFADGDPIGELPAKIQVARESLRVLVPRAS